MRFRELNARIAGLTAEGADPGLLVCECGDDACAEAIEATHAEHAEVRRHRHRFIVLPGHERPEFEQVVSRNARFVITELDPKALDRDP
jgi:hypothetical protein